MDTKQCKGCNEEKSVSEYSITNKQYGTLGSYCKPCANEMSKARRKDNPNYMKDWNRKNPGKRYQHKVKTPQVQYKSKIPAGIYYIYDKNELIYIGESSTPKRRFAHHRTKCKDLEHAKTLSSISYAVSIGELNKTDLKFKMMEYVDDALDRKSLELELINKYKPKYNTIGC